MIFTFGRHARSGANLAAFVGRGVVHNHAFNIRIGLLEDRVDRGAEKASIIEIDDDDADEGQAKRFLVAGFESEMLVAAPAASMV